MSFTTLRAVVADAAAAWATSPIGCCGFRVGAFSISLIFADAYFVSRLGPALRAVCPFLMRAISLETELSDQPFTCAIGFAAAPLFTAPLLYARLFFASFHLSKAFFAIVLR